MSKAIQTRLDFLSSEVERHDRLYHGEDQPEISDSQYDALKSELADLESANPDLSDPDSPTGRIGAPPSPLLPATTHPTPMLSLANAHTQADFLAWHARTAAALGDPRFEMAVEPKVDGLAVRLQYDNGQFQTAATRGDGRTGEDITEAVANLRAVPMNIATKHPLELRGEIYMPASAFRAINEERREAGLQEYANPRNAAAGGIRNSDPMEGRNRRLQICIYTANYGYGSHQLNLKAAELDLFPVHPSAPSARSAEEAVQAYQDLLQDREQMDMETDGAVIKVNAIASQDAIGSNSHEPRWAIAWKWPPRRERTRLHAIDITYGRFGKLTPLAVLEPVTVAGATINYATLHNLADLTRKDIRPGEDVYVQRAGDVIPQVTGPVNTDPDRPVSRWQMPTACPMCGAPVQSADNLTSHWCTDEQCPSRLPEWTEHFVSKKCMNIQHLGKSWAVALIEAGLIREDPADLYALTEADIAKAEGIGPKNAQRLLASIRSSSAQPMSRVLYSLGIYRLGRKVSEILESLCDDAWQALAMTEAELTAQEGIGPMIAHHVYQGLQSERTRRMLRKMDDAGMQVRKPQIPAKEGTDTMAMNEFFSGRTFVVTGKLENFSRTEAEAFIQENGGKTASSVSGKIDVLVVGDKPGSKLDKARNLGKEIISEAELLRMASQPQAA